MNSQELQALKLSNGKQVPIREHITAGLRVDDAERWKGLLLLFCIVCAGTPWGVLTAWDSESIHAEGPVFLLFYPLFFWVWLMLQVDHLGVSAREQG